MPLPSIINTEVNENTVTPITPELLKSMVTNLGANIPNNGNVNTLTGQLNQLVLTGTLIPAKDANNATKAAVIEVIKSAYINETTLNTDGIYKYILSVDPADTTLLASVFDTVVLNNSTTVTSTVADIPVVSFSCGDDITINYGGTDYTYTTIVGLDGKCWTSQNMRHGSMLANGSTMPTNSGAIEKWCYDTDNNGSYDATELTNCNTDGGLYTWSETMGFDASCNTTNCTQVEDTTKSVCGQLGAGWSLPTDAEWTILTGSGATGWSTPGNKLGGIASFLPGHRYFFNAFDYRGVRSLYWSSTELIAEYSWSRSMEYNQTTVNRYNTNKAIGFSVVCIKN